MKDIKVMTPHRDADRIQYVGNLGVGGGERGCVPDRRNLSVTISNATQRPDKGDGK